MKKTEFLHQCDYLGLGVRWLSEQIGTDMKTVVEWQEGVLPLPAEAQHFVAMIEEVANRAIAQQIEKGIGCLEGNSLAKGTKTSIYLITYKTDQDLKKYRPDLAGFPCTFHQRMVERVEIGLKPHGIKVRVESMDPAKYEKWLAGRTDTDQLRGEWVRFKAQKRS